VALPDLLPLVHARDAAEAKVAAIGTVNPRAPGVVNALVQSAKRFVARLLDWHVREQVEFNRALIYTIEALLETLNDYNRALVRLAESDAATRGRAEEAIQEARELTDIRSHWIEWRQEWDKALHQ
jgi:O-antigen chain-terminating methyltransferase